LLCEVHCLSWSLPSHLQQPLNDIVDVDVHFC
jgi:hypothetical protein